MVIDRQKVRMRLEAKHIELQREIAALLDEEASLGQSGRGVEDMGETAQDLLEIRQDESLLQNQRRLLAAIEEALNRLRDGTYGYCLSCGQPIPEKRLEAIPWAVRDRACQERCEK
ncbi:MAG: TraR/DksA family transcriptional regulator [Ktedonobacteraceae bacterium]